LTVDITTGLSTGVLAGIRARLEDERDRLTRRLAEQAVERSSATSGHGETDHVQIDIDRAITELLHGSAREALADVALALARLDDGSYGSCSACAVPIPVARLEAVPTTYRCFRCQEQLERGR
jgi:RNA polymerase-binding transcription factor DksA